MGLILARLAQVHRVRGALWSPADLMISPALWMNDDSVAHDAGSGACDKWYDISGNAVHATQATSTARPSIVAGAQNGRRVMRFDGSTDFMTLLSAVGLTNNALQFSFFLAADLTFYSNTPARRIVSFTIGTASNTSFRTTVSAQSGNLHHYQRRLDADGVFDNAQTYVGGPQLVGCLSDWQNAGSTLILNGTSHAAATGQGSGATSATNSTEVTIGGTSSVTGQFQQMDLYELIAMPGIPDADEVDRLMGYLAWRWGLQDSLPSNHAYRGQAPRVYATDAYAAQVASSLHCEGPATSTKILDATSRTWTANGNAQLSTDTAPFGNTSLKLGGSGDYLTHPHSDDFSAVGADITMECHIYLSASKTMACLATKRPQIANSCEWFWYVASGVMHFTAWDASGATVVSLNGSATMSVGQWYRVRVTNTGGVWRLYIDNVLDGQATATGMIGGNTEPVYLGRDPTDTARDWQGYVKGFRFTRGVARTDSIAVVPFPNPRDPIFDNVLSLVPFTGINASTTINDVKGLEWVASGNAQIQTAQTRFGSGSLHLDGAGDYVTSAQATTFWQALTNGTKAWAIEGYIRPDAIGSAQTVFDLGGIATSNIGIGLALNASGQLDFIWARGTSGTYAGRLTAGSISAAAWSKFMISYDPANSVGQKIKLWVNGVVVAHGDPSSPSASAPTNTLTLGRYVGGNLNFFKGFMAQLRITVGATRDDTLLPAAPFPIA